MTGKGYLFRKEDIDITDFAIEIFTKSFKDKDKDAESFIKKATLHILDYWQKISIEDSSGNHHYIDVPFVICHELVFSLIYRIVKESEDETRRVS
jgi:hypothetical protein